MLLCPLWVKSGEDDQRGFAAHVRFAPKADKQQIVSAGPLSAKSDITRCSKFASLLDHFVGAREYGRGDIEAERLCEGARLRGLTLVLFRRVAMP